MKWGDVDAAYPRRAYPAPPKGGSYDWREQRAFVEALLTEIARRAVGLEAGAMDAEHVKHAAYMMRVAHAHAFMTFGYGAGGTKEDAEYWKSVRALLGAALGDAAVVARCTNGKTLGAKIQKTKSFYSKARGHDLRGLARHLATAARERVPASHVEAAMLPLRAQFAASPSSPIELRDPRGARVAAGSPRSAIELRDPRVARVAAASPSSAIELRDPRVALVAAASPRSAIELRDPRVARVAAASPRSAIELRDPRVARVAAASPSSAIELRDPRVVRVAAASPSSAIELRDPRVALVAAYAVFAHVAGLAGAELAAMCRAWLDGAPLGGVDGAAQDAPAPIAMVADGDDPRARIFEQFAAVLANEETIASYRDELVADAHGFDFRVFLPDRASDAATFLCLARQPLVDGWEAIVDPHVARWLGAKPTKAALAKRRQAIEKTHARYKRPREVRAYVIRKMGFDPAVRALHVGDTRALAAYTGGGKLVAWQPNKLFKDDWRKLLRYLGAAAAAPRSGATREAVEPAWFDFLARPQTERVHWSYLLAIQAVITVDIGGGDPTTVGRELQRVLTGA